MANKGIKEGVILKQIIDNLASGDDYVTYKKILSEFLGRKLRDNESSSSFREFNILKMIISRAGDIFDYQNGEDAREGFKYKKEFVRFFERTDEEKQLKKKDGEEKKLFVTAGLQMLFNDNTISKPLIDFECINDLANLQLVKILYPFLGKTVISFKYNRGYTDIVNVVLHPHLLKEYNSRWFLFGFVQEDSENLSIYNFSIDRIVYRERNDILVRSDIHFIKAPDSYYNIYFQDIVGVTKKDNSKPVVITLKTTDYKVHQLIKTKPIHHSQKETKSFIFDKDNNEEGEFTLEVVPNIELQAKILSYGPGVYVIGDGDFQDKLRDAITQMANLYLKGSNKK